MWKMDRMLSTHTIMFSNVEATVTASAAAPVTEL
jgi:hypothetical protein